MKQLLNRGLLRNLAACRLGFLTLLLLVGGLPGLRAQNVIPLGGGSYAEYPPLFEAAKPAYPGTDGWGDLTQQFIHRKWFVVDTCTRPMPTTDWWTSLIDQAYSKNLWAYPGVVKAEDYGLFVEFPKRWKANPSGRTAELTSRSRVTIGGVNFAPKSALARRWGAWTLDWIMQDATDASRQFAVTIGHGLPFTWVECTKVKPTISMDSASFFNDAGAPVTFPITTDHFGILTKGDHYGIFAPPNTRFDLLGNTITATFASPNGYLVVGTLPGAGSLALFNTYAYTVPRDSKVTWAYDEPTAKLTSTWELVNENLRGGPQLNQIQGWLPHSYKKTTRNFTFANGVEYATPRGQLKCAIGNRFVVSYDFNGLVPGYPEPEVQAGIRHPYRPAVTRALIDQYKSVTGYRADTYWGGKNVLDYARYMQLAAQTGDKEAYEVLHKRLSDALTDWFTYTPGESAHFFSLYPNVGSFLGHRTRDNGNPGIDVLQDHAFCYGYHVYAAAILMMYDEEFKAKYKDMAKMLVLDYANYNRADKRFAYFRSFDPWAGHSYTGGTSNDDGNGEESSSEGMQAWGAMYLLGEVLGDKPMRDAGIFGYVQEAQGVAEYWFDRSHIPANGGRGNYNYGVFPKPYNGNLQSNGVGWWTWFSGDPFWMHAIQWLPMSPMLKYLYEDVPFAAWDWNSMWTSKQGSGFEGDMGNKGDMLAMTLNYFQISNPDSAAAIFDNLWDTNRTGAHAKDNNTFAYYYIHSHRTLGEIQWNQHTNLPSSTVYFNARLNQTTVVVYNPNATETVVNVYRNGTQYASFTAPAKKLIAYKFDARLTTIDVTAAGKAKTVPPGQALQFSAQGFDQYGATASTTVTWSVTGGGTINPATGLFTAGPALGSYVVTATSGTITGRYTIRVGNAPVLTTIAVSPGITRGEIGRTYQLKATGLDQYGDTVTTGFAPTWALSGGGTLTQAGLFTPTTPGGPFALSASAGGVSKRISLYVTQPLPNLALNKMQSALASSTANPITRINDGSLDTRWESTTQAPQWVVIDLGAAYDLDRVVLNWEAAFASSYTLELSSDGTTYAPLYAQPAGVGSREEITVAGTGRFLRLNLLQRGSSFKYSLYEVEVYGVPPRTGPPVLATLTLSPATVTMKDNVTQQFSLQGRDQYGASMAVAPTWSVIGRGSVSPGGLYTPSGGTVYQQSSFAVVAKAGPLQAQATVVVEEVRKLMKLDIQPDSKATNRLDLAVGSSVQLSALATDQFGVPFAGPLTWTSSDGSSVPNGRFTGNRLGNWLVIARNGTRSDTAYVAVKPFSKVNLATYKPVKTSSIQDGNEGFAGRYAVDRNLKTRWASTKMVDPQWLYVDLQAAYKLNKVVIKWEGAYATTYDVQVTNDLALPWRTIATVSGAAANGGTDSVAFAETPGRYVQVLGRTRNSVNYGYSIYEFEVYGTGLATAANQPPSVVIATPAANAVYNSLAPISIQANAADADGRVAKVEFYAGTALVATVATAPFSTTWTPPAAGPYALTARAYDDSNAQTTSAAVSVTVSAAPVVAGQLIPGRVEAESYSAMRGVATEPTADAGGGRNVSYLSPGDWLDYAVNVQTAGTYSVQLRVAGFAAGAGLQLLSGSTVLATVAVPTTGGGQRWATTPAVSVTLPAGPQTLRLAVTGGGFNLNWLDFAAPAAARTALAAKASANATAPVVGYPNPVDQIYYLPGVEEGTTVVVTNSVGITVRTLVLHNGAIDVRELPAGLYILKVEDGQRVQQVRMLKK